jgi:hypothetical protein
MAVSAPTFHLSSRHPVKFWQQFLLPNPSTPPRRCSRRSVEENKKFAFYPLLFQEQTNFTGFPRNQDGDIEEAAYNNKPLRPRLLCPSITSCVCRSRHLRRIWFEARREVSLLIIGDLTPSVRFDLLMRPAGLVVFGCDCCDCFVGLRQAMTLILEFVLLVGCSVGRG